ncbi:TRAP transporter small permease subunit [Rhodobacterales bacterium HKCCE2091]|nr:TRAP transporter small permease subunit [Rhodobacterales bacterium HKCCE2091]
MIEFLGWILSSIWGGITGFVWTILHIGQVFDWSNPENLFRFIYYGASAELLALVLLVALAVFVVGIFNSEFLWGVVRGIEGISNAVGRAAAWAGLIMVLQQVLVIFMQSIFRAAEIEIGPFGLTLTQPIGWYGDGLKLYNALVVCLCCAYTFVQGGHVRVDLFYAGWSHRTRRVSDMLVTVFFMLPSLILIWFFGWFFLWRHMITPNIASTNTLESLMPRAAAFRWNIQTFAASPSGFNAYYLFKILLVAFAGLMILQAIGFFYRSFLEFREGEDSAGKYLDHDTLDEAEAVLEERHK